MEDKCLSFEVTELVHSLWSPIRNSNTQLCPNDQTPTEGVRLSPGVPRLQGVFLCVSLCI